VKFYEVQDYLALTKHVYSPSPIMMSSVLFDSLSPDDQAAVLEASAYALPIQREASRVAEVEMTQALVDEGMQITEPDLAPFRAAVEPVYEKWAPQIGEDLIDSIRNFDY
jgi:TRAP-type C4-dicarboxylate transport system substrate-binding protein